MRVVDTDNNLAESLMSMLNDSDPNVAANAVIALEEVCDDMLPLVMLLLFNGRQYMLLIDQRV